jgi:hypothetical protein
MNCGTVLKIKKLDYLLALFCDVHYDHNIHAILLVAITNASSSKLFVKEMKLQQPNDSAVTGCTQVFLCV